MPWRVDLSTWTSSSSRAIWPRRSSSSGALSQVLEAIGRSVVRARAGVRDGAAARRAALPGRLGDDLAARRRGLPAGVARSVAPQEYRAVHRSQDHRDRARARRPRRARRGRAGGPRAADGADPSTTLARSRATRWHRGARARAASARCCGVPMLAAGPGRRRHRALSAIAVDAVRRADGRARDDVRDPGRHRDPERAAVPRAARSASASSRGSVDELRALGEISQAVGSSLDVDEVLTTIVHPGGASCRGAEGGSIFEFEPETGALPGARTCYGTERRAGGERIRRHAHRPRRHVRGAGGGERRGAAGARPRARARRPAHRRAAARRLALDAGRAAPARGRDHRRAGRAPHGARAFSGPDRRPARDAREPVGRSRSTTRACSASSRRRRSELEVGEPAQVGVPRRACRTSCGRR